MPKKFKATLKKTGTSHITDFFKEVTKGTFLLEVNKNYIKQIAEQSVKDIKERIEKQSFKSIDDKPLSKEYLEKKIAEGFDPRTFIRTGEYLKSITVIEEKKPRGVGYRVGVKPGTKSKKNPSDPFSEEVDMKLVAKWLEYGTKKMPARPHWRPTQEEILRHIADIRSKGSQNLIKKLRERLRYHRLKHKI